MISAETSALVAGGHRPLAARVKTIKVHVLRAFIADGLRVEAGTEPTLPAPFVAELVAAGKVRALPDLAAADKLPPDRAAKPKREAGTA